MSSTPEVDLRQLFARAPIGFYRSTADGRFLYVNPALAAMLGHDRVDDVLALRLAEDVYADPADRPRLIAQYGRGVVDGVEARWRTRTGAPLTVRLFGHGVDDDRGEGYEVAVVDVTALRAAEDAAAAHRVIAEHNAAALRMLVDQVPAIITMFDRELRVTSAQGSGLAELGLTSEHAVGRLLTDLGGVGPAVIAHARAALAGRSAHFEAVVSDRTLALSMAPVREGDEIVGAVSVALDVTRARRLEARVHTAQRAESLGLLAGGVAHDFNNLLVAMLGNADLALLDLPAGSSAWAAVDSIRTAALRAADLTSQLLAVSGRHVVAMAPIDVGAVVDEMVALLRPTFARAIAVDVAIDADLPRVRADATQLRQVVLNLLTNARDAVGAAGRIEIAASLVDHDGEPDDLDVITPGAGAYVRVRVADDGAGVDAAVRQRLFEPFFTTKPDGHGLGLAAVLGVVRGHGGGLRLASGPDRGTAFEMWWPVAPAAAAVVAPSRDCTILVVDDEPMVLEVVCRMLGDAGCRTVAAADGEAALALARRPELALDVAILDLAMPGLGGRATLAALRELRPSLPVIACSGFDRDRREITDVAGFLPKPFRFEQLVQMIDAVLDR
jgi:PAS domain S-box-containing protein